MKRHIATTAFALTFVLFVSTAWSADSQFFDSDGVKIHYIAAGQGEPVVLIHGFIANAQVNWVAPGIFDALAKDYRVIALDDRGHGQSGKPHGAENYGPHMAKDVINLLDHLHIEKAHIVGYSLGGFITTYLVAKYPDRIISAVPGGAGWSRPGDPNENMPDVIAEALENGEGITPLMQLLTPAGQPKPTAEQLEATNRMLLATNDPLALAGVMRGMKNMRVSAEELAASSVPVCAVVGEIDPMKSTVDAMQRVMPSLDVVVVPGGDHMSTISDPAYLAAIEKHLKSHSAFAVTKEHEPEPAAVASGE